MIRTTRTGHAEFLLVDLYREIAQSRSVVIEEALADVRELPEAPAETLTLAAAALAHLAGVPSAHEVGQVRRDRPGPGTDHAHAQLE